MLGAWLSRCLELPVAPALPSYVEDISHTYAIGWRHFVSWNYRFLDEIHRGGIEWRRAPTAWSKSWLWLAYASSTAWDWSPNLIGRLFTPILRFTGDDSSRVGPESVRTPRRPRIPRRSPSGGQGRVGPRGNEDVERGEPPSDTETRLVS